MNKYIKNIIDDQFSVYEKPQNYSIDDIMLEDDDILLQYADNNINLNAKDNLSPGCKYRLELLLPYIHNYITNRNIKKFDLLIGLGDLIRKEHNIPSICFSKNKTINSILIPNIDFFTGAIHQFFTTVQKTDIPYTLKLKNSIFIGSSTGPFKNNTRALFCDMCLGSDRHKAYIHNLCQNDREEWIKEYPNIEKSIVEGIGIWDQIKSKVVVNIDGNTACWSRLYWQMLSNSIPVYINKIDTDIQFFDYIDNSSTYVSCSLSDSIKTINSILDLSDNNKQITEMNQAGKEYVTNCFAPYMQNPVEFLKTTITEILDRLLLN